MRPREQKWVTDKDGFWYVLQDRSSGPVVPEHHGQVHRGEIDDMSRSIEDLKQTGDGLVRLAVLADQSDARNRALEASLVATKKLYQYMKARIPFAGGPAAGGSDISTGYSTPPVSSEKKGMDEGFWMSRFKAAVGIAEPDPKDNDLTREQRNFLANLRMSRR